MWGGCDTSTKITAARQQMKLLGQLCTIRHLDWCLHGRIFNGYDCLKNRPTSWTIWITISETEVWLKNNPFLNSYLFRKHFQLIFCLCLRDIRETSGTREYKTNVWNSKSRVSLDASEFRPKYMDKKKKMYRFRPKINR